MGCFIDRSHHRDRRDTLTPRIENVQCGLDHPAPVLELVRYDLGSADNSMFPRRVHVVKGRPVRILLKAFAVINADVKKGHGRISSC